MLPNGMCHVYRLRGPLALLCFVFVLPLSTLVRPAQCGAVTYDLVLTGGRVIDPAAQLDGVRNIAISNGKVAAISTRALQGKQRIVPGCDIARRGKVGGRSEPETAQNRGDMDRDPDSGARRQAALVALTPVGEGRPLVVKMSVDVDKHCHNLRPFYLGGFLSGEIGMETTVSRARAVLFEPRATFKEVDSEFTKPGAIWGRYILPLALLGPLAGAIGRLVFGKRIAGMSLPESVSITGATIWFGISLVLQLAAVFGLTQIISLLAPGFGGQKNDVQALKVAAYASTPMWVAGIFNIHGRFLMVGIIISLYSLYLLYLGLPTLMKVPQDRSMGYTAVVIIAAIVVFLLVSTYTLF